MTHMREYLESEGVLKTLGEPVTRHCRRCKAMTSVVIQLWTSNDGAFEDYKFICQVCGLVWWVDGIDS